MFDRYLIDTGVLSRLTPDERRSPFMRQRCQLPEEIVYEARGLPDIEELMHMVYPTTPTVLFYVKAVLAEIVPGDKIVDLYRNEGNGDVFLLAIALAEMAVSETQLIGDVWSIVTVDKGLTATASALGVSTCALDSFRDLLHGG